MALSKARDRRDALTVALDLKGSSASHGLWSHGGEAKELARAKDGSLQIWLFFKPREEPQWPQQAGLCYRSFCSRVTAPLSFLGYGPGLAAKAVRGPGVLC